MSQLTPEMDEALGGLRVKIFGAVRIDLNDGRVIRLLDGAGRAEFGAGVFKGRDSTFGTIQAVEAISDGIGDEAPGITLTLTPASSAASADLSSPDMQGSRIRFWLGAVNPKTGAVIPDPHPLFDGELDVPVLHVGPKEFTLDLECVSGGERLFENEEGVRLSDAFHQSVWPGETGLAYMTGITRDIIWGPGDRPASSITYPGGSISGGLGAYFGAGTTLDRLGLGYLAHA
jgi:hypothetical protein